jgi:predicted metal-dependent peptidase
MPKVGLLDEKYRDLTSNEVYDLLYEEQEKNGDQGYETMDVHMEPGKGDPNEGDGDGEDGKGAPNGPVQISKDEAKQLSDDMKQAGAGNVPGGVKRLLKDLLEPEMDWRELLQMDIDSAFKSDFTFARPNRKASSMGGIVLPGLDTDTMIKVAIAIDTSGSISHDMLRDFLSEVKGIMDQHQDFELKLWFFDTSTYTVHSFTPDNMTDILEVNIEGGGGTCFDVNFEMMKEIDLVPERFIMFTDGYPFGSWGDEMYCETIFLIHGNGASDAPFGTTLRYTRT